MNDRARNDQAAKWLRLMLYAGAASLITSIITLLSFVPDAVTIWIGRAISVTLIVSMFQLASIHQRYKTAGIFRATVLAATLLTAYVSASPIFTLAASILSILSEYQQYNAHAELIEEADSELAQSWRSLFYWGLGMGLLMSFASFIGAVFAVTLGMTTASAVALIAAVVSIPQFIIELIYLRNLRKMLQILEGDSEA